MKRKLSLITIILVLIKAVSAQSNFIVSGTIKGYEQKPLIISNIYGHLQNQMDTIITDDKGFFNYTYSQRKQSGLLRIELLNNKYIDLIFGNENIEFYTIEGFLLDSLRVKSSLENQIYYEFHQFLYSNQFKMQLLTPLITYYPDKDDFYNQVIVKFKALQNEILDKMKQVETKNENSFAIHLIKGEQDPVLYWNPDKIKRDEFLKKEFLANVDFNSIELLQSDLFPSKIIQYFSLFQDEGLSQEQQGIEYIKAIDNILTRAGNNKIVFDYVFDFILDGFERFDYPNVIDFLDKAATAYSTCTDESESEDVKQRIEKYKKLNVGSKAPDFELKSNDDDTIHLYSIDSEFTLIMFWASWCGHCNNMMPEIVALYNLQSSKRMKVFAISLDNNKNDWQQAIKEHPSDWIQISQLQGWDSPIADTYNVFATPTFFLLDSNKIILEKPINAYQLEQALINHNVLSPK